MIASTEGAPKVQEPRTEFSQSFSANAVPPFGVLPSISMDPRHTPTANRTWNTTGDVEMETTTTNPAVADASEGDSSMLIAPAVSNLASRSPGTHYLAEGMDQKLRLIERLAEVQERGHDPFESSIDDEDGGDDKS